MSTTVSNVLEIGPLLHELLFRMGRNDGLLEEVRPLVDTRWDQGLEDVLPTVGLTPRWIHADSNTLASAVRTDLPLVTWIERETGGSWVLALASRMGRVQVLELGSSSAPSWVDPRKWFGTEPRRWARVLPVLPASPLGDEATPNRSPTSRLLSLLTVERQDVGVVVIFAVAIGLLSLATPLAIQLLINWLAFGMLLQPIVTLGFALLLCLTLVAVLGAAQRHTVEIVQRRLFVRTVSDLSARLARVRLNAYDKAYGPELANRFFDVVTLQKAASTLLLDGLAATLQAAVGLLLLALYHPVLLVFDLVVVAMTGAVLFGLSRGAQRTAIIESKRKYAVAAWLEEIARHPTVFKHGGGQFAGQRTDSLVHAYLDARTAHFRVFFRQFLGMQTIAVVLPASLLVMTGWLVLEGQLTLGQLVAAEFIVASALAGIAKFINKLETVYDLLAGVDKLGGLFDLPLESTEGATPRHSADPASVAIHGVKVGGGGPAVSFGIPAGGRAAVLGPPGSGKSTLCHLALGLRNTTSGSVSRDGVPLPSSRAGALLDESLLVSEAGLLHASVRDNLTLGEVVDEARIWEVLERLDLAAALRTLPKGLDTEVLPSGAPLSRSQSLGLLLARARLLERRFTAIDGLLELAPPQLRSDWIEFVTEPSFRSTVLITTHDPAIAAAIGTVHTLHAGGAGV